MFHTILTLSYLIPSLYLFIRIWQLFIPRQRRGLFIVIYLLLFLVFPVSNLVIERNAGIEAQILEKAANYLLPFFLYLFLLVLLTDFLLLINLAIKLIPVEKLKKNSTRIKALTIIIFVSLIIVVSGIINFNTIRISGYRIDVGRKSCNLSSLRIAFVSDFHLQESTPRWFVEKYVQKINSIRPDLLLYGGDIVEGDSGNESIKSFETLLSSLRPVYGVYGVPGNHEHYSRQDPDSFFINSGIRMLSDSSVVLQNSFVLLGRNDSHIRNRKNVDELMRSVPDTLPVIIIDHRPSEIEQVSKTHSDIQFSGHTHNGQLFPINLITRKVYLLSWGYRKFGNTHFFVSSGIRLWGPPVRTTGKSEIMVVDVNFVSKE